MYKLNISPLAFQVLENTKIYISEKLQNVTASENTIKHILKQIRSLVQNPLIGSPLSAHIDIETNYRFLVCKNYLVFYYIESTDIYISRIIYGKRDYAKILFEKNSNDS